MLSASDVPQTEHEALAEIRDPQRREQLVEELRAPSADQVVDDLMDEGPLILPGSQGVRVETLSNGRGVAVKRSDRQQVIGSATGGGRGSRVAHRMRRHRHPSRSAGDRVRLR